MLFCIGFASFFWSRSLLLAASSSAPKIAFVLGFSLDPSPRNFTDFHLEDVALDKNLNKLTVSDEAGVEVTSTPTGRYNTNIQKKSESGERVVTTDSTPNEGLGAEKYKVKKNHSPDNE